MASAEVLISVDVEASGPSPSTGSLIALGACLVVDPSQAFYVEVRPLPGMPWSAEAERVHGLSRAHLEQEGREPAGAMEAFAQWVESVAQGRRPVFVALNATFDWMFVADYCHRFLERNPFGISGLDIKAYYMGKHEVPEWAETSKWLIAERYGDRIVPSHHALEDARAQARLMRHLLGDGTRTGSPRD